MDLRRIGRPVRAVLGALGFLSRLPVGRDERAWDAFRTAPWALPVAGYLLGAVAALPFAAAAFVSLPGQTVAFGYVVAVVALTGVNHFDGVADLGDATVVHGGPERRREVMADTVLGVGGALALGVVFVGLALAGLSLAGLPVRIAVAVVIAAEVSAKVAMAALICLGAPAHEGMGAQVAAPLGARHLALPLALGVPAAALGWQWLLGPAALAGGVVAALALGRWARRRLGGVSGDVFGAGNELARVVALHAALVAHRLTADATLPEVIAWTPS